MPWIVAVPSAGVAEVPATQNEVLCVEPSMHCGCTDVHPVEYCKDFSCGRCYEVPGLLDRSSTPELGEAVMEEVLEVPATPLRWGPAPEPECPGAPAIRRSARISRLPATGSQWVAPTDDGFVWKPNSFFGVPSPA